MLKDHIIHRMIKEWDYFGVYDLVSNGYNLNLVGEG